MFASRKDKASGRIVGNYVDFRMKQLPEKLLPIESFPVLWSEILTSLMGPHSFHLDVPFRDRMQLPKEWLGVVSSHQNKHGFANRDWQESLLSALQLARSQGWGVLCAQDAPYSDVVIHGCKRLHVPFRVIRVVNWSEPIPQFESLSISDSQSCDCGALLLGCAGEREINKIPIHDLASVFLSNHLFVLELRDGGKIAQLLEQRLRCLDIPKGTTYLSLRTINSPKSRQTIRTDWLDRGAIGWLNPRNPDLSESHSKLQTGNIGCGPLTESRKNETYQPIFPIRLFRSESAQFLIHCTRSRRGPWPDQSIDQFHDELMQSPWETQPTVLETLQKILTQQRLIATNNFRQGNIDTVCFSSNEITELLSMRKFQSHLARWDWEPYGIMIERAWLESNGAKQVSYIDRANAKHMSKDALAFCQVVSGDSNSTDWQTEKEWRIAGDVRLTKVPLSKAIVFVQTYSEARALQPISRWPIVVTDW